MSSGEPLAPRGQVCPAASRLHSMHAIQTDASRAEYVSLIRINIC